MPNYIFPFDKVERGANIILYGFGEVGQSYYGQIDSTNYCKVQTIIDDELDKYKGSYFNVDSVNNLYQYQYDYIVVAHDYVSNAKKAKERLIETFNVPADRIICEVDRQYVKAFSLATLKTLMLGYEKLMEVIDDFLINGNGLLNYFTNIIKELRDASLTQNEREEYLEYFKKYLSNEKNIRRKIVLLRLMHQAKCFDCECTKFFMNAIDEIYDDYDARVWLMWDLSFIELQDANIRYQDYFVDKRRIIRDTMNYYIQDLKVKKGEGSNDGKRIAIIGANFNNVNSSHFKFMYPRVNAVERRGYKIKVFPTDLLRYSFGETFIEPISMQKKDSHKVYEKYNNYLNKGIDVVIPKGNSIRERVRDFTTKLFDYNPDVVYDFSGEYAFCSSIYYDAFPTVALPMRGYISSTWFDIYIARDKELWERENDFFAAMKEEQIVIGNPLPMKAYSIPEGYKREKFGINNEDFIVVTSGMRLDGEMTDEFVETVCSFILNHTNIKWIVVSPQKISSNNLKYRMLVEKGLIIEWGYEFNLMALYQMCDMYWEPIRNGSGGCVMQALICGLPIVTTDFPSDFLALFGIENAVCGGYRECLRYAEHLYGDPILYEEKSNLMKSISNRLSDDGERFIEVLLHAGEMAKKMKNFLQ